MRRLGFWVLFSLAGAAAIVVLLYLNQDSNIESGSIYEHCAIFKVATRRIGRKNIEESNTLTTRRPKVSIESFNVADYPHFDPTPSSKASVKHGPIEHGTPLMPFIPHPVPPPPPTSFNSGPVDRSGSGPVSANQPAPCPPDKN